MTDSQTLDGGFRDVPVEAARAFRGLMSAMARPGRIERVEGAAPPPPLSKAAGAVLLTLADHATPVFLAGGADTAGVRDWLRFHTGAPLGGPGHAAFAVGPWADLIPLSQYPVGTPEYPDRSATLIVEVETLDGPGVRLTGPGIETEASLPLPDAEVLRANAAQFPLGLDLILTCGDRLAALPRSTRIG